MTVQPCPLLTTLFALRRTLAVSTSYMSMGSLAVPAPLLVKCRQSLCSSFKLAATPWCFTIIQCPHLTTSLLYSLAAVKENFKYHTIINARMTGNKKLEMEGHFLLPSKTASKKLSEQQSSCEIVKEKKKEIRQLHSRGHSLNKIDWQWIQDSLRPR